MDRFFFKRIFPFFFFVLFFCGFSLEAQSQPEKRFYKEGMRRLQEKDYALAQSLLSEYISTTSNAFFLPESYLALGIAQFYLGKEKEAYALFLELDRQFKESFANSCGLFWRAVCCYNAKEYDKAISLLEHYLSFELEKKENEKIFFDLTEQRNRAFLYLTWSYYKANRKEFAYKNGIRAINEGVPPDFDFSFFSLLASLLQERGEMELLSTLLKNCDESKWGEKQQLYCKLYKAEIQLLLRGGYPALPLFTEIVESTSMQEAELDSLYLYCYQRIFLIYESRNELNKMAELALFFHQKAKEDRLKKYARELMLRCVAVYFQKNRPKEVHHFTELLLKENPLDVEAWYFHIMALKQLAPTSQTPSFFETLPSLVKEQLLELRGKIALEKGDFLLIQMAQEFATQEKWEESLFYAQFLIEHYRESPFYLQALYLCSYGVAKKSGYQQALTQLQEDSTYQSLQYLFQSTILDPWFDEKGFTKEMNERKEQELISLFFLEAHLLRVTKKGKEALALYDFLLEYYKKKKIDFSQRRLLFNASLTAFQEKDYIKLQHYQSLLMKKESALDEKDRLLLSYFEALSYIAQKKYQPALEILNPIELNRFEENQMHEIIAWFLYYRAWANYRYGEYKKAEKEFARILKEFPEFEWKKEVRTLAGWSTLSCQDYQSAATFFGEAAKEAVDPKTRDENRLLQGRAFLLGGELESGQKLLKQLAESEKGFYGDHAFMELAASFYREKQFVKAGDHYLQLTKRYSQSRYAQEALFLAGESYFVGKEFFKASDLYDLYQKQYPKGVNTEVALYRNALALMRLNKVAEASFQFQRLLENFPSSLYESQTLLHLGEIAAARKEWEKASYWYRELQKRFPVESKSVNVAHKLNSLFFQQQGRSSKESELLVLIQENGIQRRRGREAALQLSDLYLTLYRNEENQKQAIAWLESIATLFEKNSADATQAVLLLAEESKRRGEYQKAMNYYTQLLSWKPSKEKSAQFLHLAIVCALEAGSNEDALFLYELLKKDYDKTEWVKKTEELPLWQRFSQGVVYE